MRARRAFGLQGWLVAALLAVGLAASLAVLLVVLPTLESSVRTDRAKREAQELRAELAQLGDKGLSFGVALGQVQGLADEISAVTGAEVAILYEAGDVFGRQSARVTSPADPVYLDRVVRGVGYAFGGEDGRAP